MPADHDSALCFRPSVTLTVHIDSQVQVTGSWSGQRGGDSLSPHSLWRQAVATPIPRQYLRATIAVGAGDPPVKLGLSQFVFKE